MDVWITKDGYSSSSFVSAILNMSHSIGTSIHREWSSTGPHCVNVVTVTVKYFKMRVRIHSTHAMDDKIPRSSSVCACCKWSKTGGVENLGMRLGVIYWSILCFHPNFLPYIKLIGYLRFQWIPVLQCKKVVSVNIRLTALFGSEDPTVQLISTKVRYNGCSQMSNHFLQDVCLALW